MKYIVKGNEPNEVLRWKARAIPPTWEKLTGNTKKALRKSLLEEQGYICAYCQKRIHEVEYIVDVQGNRRKVMSTEIEHIVPRCHCLTEDKKIDYDNLIASCDGNTRKNNRDIPFDARHCNNHRGYDLLMISPLMVNCENYFSYEFNGGIVGNIPDAVDTISKLNLTILKPTRVSKINGVLPLEIIDSITNVEIQTLINYYNLKSDIDHDGKIKFPEYSAVIINLLGQLNGN